MENTKKTPWEIAVVGLKLLLICAIVAGVVSLVYTVTEEPYAKKLEEEKRLAITELFHPDITYSDLRDQLQSDLPIYQVMEADGNKIGYCVEVTTAGYGGDMQIMVAYNADGTIRGVSVVSHNETPGLGDKIKNDESHTKQYEGKSGTLTLGTDIDAIGGATYSSRYLLEGVNKATAAIEKYTPMLNGGAANE